MFIKDAIEGKKNNFDLIRLILSLSVMYFHAFGFCGVPQNDVISHYLWKYNLSIGSIAVFCFFFLSGLLVNFSYEKKGGALSFSMSRIFRIYPALVICLLFTIIVVGPIASTLSLNEYISSPDVLNYLFNNLKMNTDFVLPGVFNSNNYKDSVNGSLWTLRWEIICYILLLAIHLFSKTKKNRMAVYILIILASASGNGTLLAPFEGGLEVSLFPFAFFLGALSANISLQENNSIVEKYIAIVIMIVLISPDNVKSTLLIIMSLSVIILLSLKLKPLKLKLDISYGIYIYAFPIQQLISFYHPNISVINSLILSGMIIIPLSYLSFRFIETPAINLGRIIIKQNTGKIKQQEIKRDV